MKIKGALALLLVFLTLFAVGCGGKDAEPDNEVKGNDQSEKKNETVITDYVGNELVFASPPSRVVALSGSFGEIWLNAGGKLVGVTDDALDERGLELSEDTAIVGTVKNPDLESVLVCEPDFVIMSADTTSHVEAAESLRQAGIPYGLFHVEFFDDYLKLLDSFTQLTGREDMYEKNGVEVKAQIDKVLDNSGSLEGKTVLFLRAYSSGFKAKDSQNMTGAMLADFGLENILDKYDDLLEDISLEEIITADPDYIFVTTMGSSQKALDNLDAVLTGSAAWKDLTAIAEGRYYILPQELFHYKPNARWGESYQYLSDLLFDK